MAKASAVNKNDKRIKLYKNKGNKGIIHSLRLGLKKCSANVKSNSNA